MNIALSALFALVAAGSIAAIWQAIASNLDAVADLHRRMAMPAYGSEVTVSFREQTTDLDPVAMIRRPRQVRVPAPKPVTHRLHHFAKTRDVA